MARSKKITLISTELKNQCSKEDAPFIRELLDILYENSIINLSKCREDHRFRQGSLQILEEIDGIISNK